MKITFESVALTQLAKLAENLVQLLPSPCVVGLVGTLGAGKTTMVQYIAEAAGIETAEVTSPTFTLLQTHHGTSIRLHHIDAYRLADEEEFIELGVDELFDDQAAWTVVEWADQVDPCMPPQTLWIQISLTDQPDRRTLELTCADETIAPLLQRLGILFPEDKQLDH
jgi:tRNA threonylcarbamoyladenosine biosynthesis protein TsaE